MAGPITHVDGGTITSARGFQAGATYVGIKTFSEDKMDMGLLISDTSCSVAGVFTKSSLVSPSVTVNRETIAAGGSVRGLVVNSGIANAGVGEQGYIDAKEMASIAAGGLGVEPEEVLVFSTGVIGVELPMTLIKKGVGEIKLSDDGGNFLARSMMTTDTRTKETGVIVNLGGTDVNICGVAKGSGMIHPNMATMLCFMATDAKVQPAFLQSIVSEAVSASFNMIDVDGDMSTNDTVLVLANGAAGGPEIVPDSEGADAFREAITYVSTVLAKELARDGEGAQRLIEVVVDGAKNLSDARTAARSIASSLLVKSMVHGRDPNWGRIMMALGKSNIDFSENQVDLFISDIHMVHEGVAFPYMKEAVINAMSVPEVQIRVNVNNGDASATAWGCDLTEEYVTFNSAYST